jgi:hypothetical protein
VLRIRDILVRIHQSRISTTDLRIRIWFRIRIFILLTLRTCEILVGIRIRGSVPLTYGSGFRSGSGLSRIILTLLSVEERFSICHWWGYVTFWYGSRFTDQYHWLTDPDLVPDLDLHIRIVKGISEWQEWKRDVYGTSCCEGMYCLRCVLYCLQRGYELPAMCTVPSNHLISSPFSHKIIFISGKP